MLSPGLIAHSSNHTFSPSARNRSAAARTTALSFELWLRNTSNENESLISGMSPGPTTEVPLRGGGTTPTARPISGNDSIPMKGPVHSLWGDVGPRSPEATAKRDRNQTVASYIEGKPHARTRVQTRRCAVFGEYLPTNNTVFGQWGRHLACHAFPTGGLDAYPTTHHDFDLGGALKRAGPRAMPWSSWASPWSSGATPWGIVAEPRALPWAKYSQPFRLGHWLLVFTLKG